MVLPVPEIKGEMAQNGKAPAQLPRALMWT